MFPSATDTYGDRKIRVRGGSYTDFNTAKSLCATSPNCEILSDQYLGSFGK